MSEKIGYALLAGGLAFRLMLTVLGTYTVRGPQTRVTLVLIISPAFLGRFLSHFLYQ